MPIESESEFRDFYLLLGIKITATQSEIKAAYRNGVRQYHPDFNPNDPHAEEITKQLNEAKEVLFDPDKREAYDRLYQEHLRKRTPKRKPERIKYELATRITLKQAYYGLEKLIASADFEIQVKIPAGVDTGDQLHIRLEHSDLYLTIEVLPDPLIRREGLDLFCDVSIDVFTAMLGGDVIVRFFEEEFIMHVPSGTPSDQPVRIRKKGMVSADIPRERGNLYLRLLIQIPKDIYGERLRKVEELAELFRKSDR